MLIITASSNHSSINNKVFVAVERKLQGKPVRFEHIDLKIYLDTPLLLASKQMIPETMTSTYKKICEHKHIVIFAPEHNGYFSAFFKNILDWWSRHSETLFEQKHILVISVSRTDKNKRAMEEGVKNTFYKLKAEKCDFINFNEYSDAILNGDRVKKLSEIIIQFPNS